MRATVRSEDIRATITFFPNGVTMAHRGSEQITGLQQPWLELYAEFLVTKGQDPAKFRLILPGGMKAKFVPKQGGWNWIIDNDRSESSKDNR